MVEDREESCAALPVPLDLSEVVDGYAWARSNVGESGADVYRLGGKAGAPDLFLKHGRGNVADDLADEMVRLRWLARHVPVPRVVHFSASSEDAWLLMTALAGETAFQVLEARPQDGVAIVDALADFLRRFHAIPVDQCPFNGGHAFRLALARKRIDAGLVDVDDFDDERAGWTAEQVWQAMHERLPFTPERVVTHGDFSLDNLLMADGQVVGCIDAGRVGIADRYQDLAIAWNCLGEFGSGLDSRFLTRYGVVVPDQGRLDFHLMLDELF